jgi:hypothetical protein
MESIAPSTPLPSRLGPSGTDDPFALPFCAFPRAADVARHGLYDLPEPLPRLDFARAERHRRRRHRAVPASLLPPERVLELATVIGASFAQREPQSRHLRLPGLPPPALAGARHSDGLGTDSFGPWTTVRVLYWFARLLILTDPGSPRSAVRLNTAALEQSLAILDETGNVIGGAFNDAVPPPGAAAEMRADDPFLDVVLGFAGPILSFLGAQDEVAIAALSRDPAFAEAHARGRVGHHYMVARSDALPKTDAFELVAATAERYAELGFAYVLTEATNQWTGAACEALGGVRVHFAPFRTERRVAASPVPHPHEVTSRDGYLAGKDSGSMLYVLRL